MDRKQLIWPNEWPHLPNSAHPFVWHCCANDVKWVTHNKRFFFRAQSCLTGQPLLPQLLMCIAIDGSRRAERFRITNSKFVGIGYINQYGNINGQTADTVMVEVGLIRVEKPEYELLVKEGPQLARGRRPSPILRISDFVSTDTDDAVLTHWLESPQNVDSPFRQRIDQILPQDLRRQCVDALVTNSDHPFAADFQMNRRLLPQDNPEFSFIDLFAGVGGFRMAMQQEGGVCVFASEIDKSACRTYKRNFGVLPFGDITKDETKAMIPAQFDVLCAGFPCQAFSIAGLRQGFNDELQRGTLYRQVVEIAQRHQPKIIFCENVKGLLSSAEGRALEVIEDEIEAVGYHVVFDSVLNSRRYGVPQNRERLYIVAVRNDIHERMVARGIAFPARPDPIPGNHPHTIGEILEDGPVSKSYYLGQDYLNTLIRHRNRHAEAGRSGFGYIVRDRGDVAGTLMCGGMGRERNMICDENQPDWNPTPKMHGGMNNQHLRFLTVREWARLQGFPDYFEVPESIQAGYKQFGNCVTVKTIRAVGRAIITLVNQCQQEEHENGNEL